MYDPSIARGHLDPAFMAKLPEPTGYRVLVAIPQVEEKTKGGIYRPDEIREREQMASVFGLVLKLGPDAYLDKERFPNGPLCKVGDWVLFRPYSGTRFRHCGNEFRVINDDTVEAVVVSPEEYERA